MFTEVFYRIAFAIVLISTFGSSLYFGSKANRKGGSVPPEQEGKLILWGRRIFGLGMWLTVFIYPIAPGLLRWSFVTLPDWLRLAGLVLGVLLAPVVYWTTSSLGNNRTGTVSTREEHELVTHGPYRWVRHPIYTIGMLGFVAYSLISSSWLMLLFAGLAIFFVTMRTPQEEDMLIEQFGNEYLDYMRRTGRYLPRLRRAA